MQTPEVARPNRQVFQTSIHCLCCLNRCSLNYCQVNRKLTLSEGIDAVGQSIWLETVELGLTLWQGAFEESVSRLWLRWCDQLRNRFPVCGCAGVISKGKSFQQEQNELMQNAKEPIA